LPAPVNSKQTPVDPDQSTIREFNSEIQHLLRFLEISERP